MKNERRYMKEWYQVSFINTDAHKKEFLALIDKQGIEVKGRDGHYRIWIDVATANAIERMLLWVKFETDSIGRYITSNEG